MESQSTGARVRGVGAVARGDGPHRRRGLFWLLGALLLLAIIAVALIALLSGGSGHKKPVSARGTATAPASGAAPAAGATSATAAPAAGASGSSTTVAPAPAAGAASSSTTAAPAAPIAGTRSTGGLVGGGGITARAATGRLAAAGSIGAVLFAEDGTGLDANARAVVATAVKEIRARHSSTVTAVGYTDKIGNAAANRMLSLQRARAVIAAIRQRLTGSAARFDAKALGEGHPIAPNTTPSGRQLDRRVAIFVNR